MPAPRFTVGIDLGTTNSAVAFRRHLRGVRVRRPDQDLPRPAAGRARRGRGQDALAVEHVLPGGQRGARGFDRAAVGSRPRARRRLPGAGARRAGPHPAGALGEELAVPPRRRSPRTDPAVGGHRRRAAPLAGAGRGRVPRPHPRGLERSSRAGARDRLEEQEIYLTVPASFDAVARQLTMEAAREAGLAHVTLLEEPQAAFYCWIGSNAQDWRKGWGRAGWCSSATSAAAPPTSR